MGDLNGLVWVGGVVKALEDSNEAVRYAARDAIPRIYKCVCLFLLFIIDYAHLTQLY